nr:hypothetical protein [Tanacetum cinerariifolium]
MSTPTFAETHNLVAFLEKPAESAGFEQIIDFFKSKPIHYALTVNPTIYVSCVKQFWATAKVKKVNDKELIHALVDKTKAIITEDSIRSDLRFDDAEGTACLLNEAIFEGLARMSGTMASAIICLADNQKFNFSKYIFDNMVKSLEGGVKFYPFLRFLIFVNMRRIGAGFSGVITPLFDSMMVQATADMGDTTVETHQTPIVDQPSTSKPQKKQQLRRKQRKEAEVSYDDSEDEDHIPTPSSDPLHCDEDSSILNELMVFCTSLQEQVLDLQEAKAAQAKEIAALKKKASKLNKWRKSRSGGLGRLKKIVMETTTGVQDSVAPTTYVSEYKVTVAQALAALNSTKPKVVIQEQEMSTTILAAATIVTTDVPTPRAKGKAKMIESEVPIKKKDQIRIDEEFARKLEAEEQEAARISIAQQDKEANNSLDNMQAIMDANRVLAERLQARKREDFSEVQKARLLVKLIEKRKKHFVALRAQEKRNKPPTKTQMKSQMSTYLRHMGGYKQSHLKRRSFDEIKELFDREMTKVNDFIAMDSEAQESSTKRTAKHLESDISKEQKVDENVEPDIDNSEELKKCIELVPGGGDDVLIEATPISSRSPTIIDYKIHKEGKKNYFKIIRADVKDIFKKEKPVNDMDNILFRTLKTMFEHHVEDTIWKYQQGLAKVKKWKLFESCGVYCITMQSTIYYLLVKKVYPLTRNTLHQLWNDVRLQVDYDVEMAYDLLRFIRKQLMEGYTP